MKLNFQQEHLPDISSKSSLSLFMFIMTKHHC